MIRPTPTLEMKLNRDISTARVDELTTLVGIVEQAREMNGNRAAVELLLNGVGMIPTTVRNDSYYREMLDFQLGILLAHLGRPEAAADLIRRSGALPHSGGNGLFPDCIAESLELHAHAIQAAQRGMPPILIAAMPAAGSASLTQSIAATLDMPIIRLSAGAFPDFTLMPSWFESFCSGGSLTHDHFGASAFNLRVLEEAGWREVFVLIRDPRAGAASTVRKEAAAHGKVLEGEQAEQRIVHTASTAYIPWLNLWSAAEGRASLQIHWISYDEIRLNVGAIIRRILETLAPAYPAIAAMTNLETRAVTANFATGNDEAWRALVRAETSRWLLQTIHPRAAELLDLKP